MDRYCSGQISCEVPVTDLIHLTNPCTNDLRSYLQASFTCIPSELSLKFESQYMYLDNQNGITGLNINITQILLQETFCYTMNYVAVAEHSGNCCQFAEARMIVRVGSGFLANSITLGTGCGSRDCPWQLQALEGQRINISIYDFGLCKYCIKTYSTSYSFDILYATNFRWGSDYEYDVLIITSFFND